MLLKMCLPNKMLVRLFARPGMEVMLSAVLNTTGTSPACSRRWPGRSSTRRTMSWVREKRNIYNVADFLDKVIKNTIMKIIDCLYFFLCNLSVVIKC